MSAADDIDYEDDPPHPKYVYRGGKYDGTIKQISVALIIAGIIGFVGMAFAFNGAISNLERTTAVLTTAQAFQQRQIDDLKAADQRIEGKVFRGHARAMGLDDADQP
jgi:hypothetical protein